MLDSSFVDVKSLLLDAQACWPEFTWPGVHVKVEGEDQSNRVVLWPLYTHTVSAHVPHPTPTSYIQVNNYYN